jgi:hypothetical protein
MSSIVPFSGGQLPAYLKNKSVLAGINKDVAVGAQYPTLSIKGKVFTLVKDNERKIMMRLDEPDEVAQSINLSVVRANTKSRVLYLKEYVEGEAENARPDCSSNDGVAPEANSGAPQSKKCAICPHAVWGSGRNGEGTRCSVNTRLAVSDPDNLDLQFLLRVPAGSRKNFADAVKAADTRGIPYNALVMKVGFDPTAPSPKLTFKPIGLLDDAGYAKASARYDTELVRSIVGLHADETVEVADEVATDELDAAIAAKAVVKQAQVKPKPVAAPALDLTELDALVDQVAPAKPEPVKAKPKPKPVEVKPEPVAVAPAAAGTGMDDLLGDLDALLGNSDD